MRLALGVTPWIKSFSRRSMRRVRMHLPTLPSGLLGGFGDYALSCRTGRYVANRRLRA